MACPHCGCRLVSPSRSDQARLVCSDCGRPMDSHLQGEAPLAGWRPMATAALILVLGLSVLAMLTLRAWLGGEEETLTAPAPEQVRLDGAE